MGKIVQTISFDNNYPKLCGQKTARLLAVFNDVSGELLRKKMRDFLFYDTKRDDGRYFYLDPRENYMILLFEGNLGVLFSSIRKANEENIDKYNGLIGEIFLIEIQN